MDQSTSSILDHKFRVENHTITLLIKKLQKAQVPPEKIGEMAQAVLTIATHGATRQEIAEQLKAASQEHPELRLVSEQEDLYAKKQAEKIIKESVEMLVQQGNFEQAAQLARSINYGELPLEMQRKIDTI